MREVGEVTHLARSGRLIVRLSREVNSGTVLLDSKGRKACRVMELLGPVAHPYASAIPASSKFGTSGQKVYIPD